MELNLYINIKIQPYIKYFNYAKRNQNNPNIPRIKGSYIRIGNDAYVVRLEKLQEISGEQYKKLEKIANSSGQ